MNIIHATPLDNAREAIVLLEELLETPMMRSIHFELDVELDGIPIIRYEIERMVVKQNDYTIENDGTYRGGE